MGVAPARYHDCSKCGEKRETRHGYCRSCRNAYMREWYRRKGPEYMRARSLARGSQGGENRVRVKPEDYAEWLARQAGVCAICALPEADNRHGVLNFDHDHATGKIRGLLCSNCNTALGLLKDDPERFRNALRYLRREA